jgi:hypothetical protein
MTEGERVFYRRRIKEELNLARVMASSERKTLHLQWAQYFNERLDGKRCKTPPPLPGH